MKSTSLLRSFGTCSLTSRNAALDPSDLSCPGMAQAPCLVFPLTVSNATMPFTLTPPSRRAASRGHHQHPPAWNTSFPWAAVEDGLRAGCQARYDKPLVRIVRRCSNEDGQGHHHGRGGEGLPQLQHVLPGRSELRGRGIHRRADTGHRGPLLPCEARRGALPGGHPHTFGGGAPGADKQAGGGAGGPRVLRPVLRGGDAQGLPDPGHRRRLPPHGQRAHRPAVRRSGGERVRGAHRFRQEPHHQEDMQDPALEGPEGRGHQAPHALRRPVQAGLPEVRRLRGPGPPRDHHRGEGGVRAADRRRHHRVRRGRLRAHPAGGGEGGGRDSVGRRKQRHPVLPQRPEDRHRRPAQTGP